MWTLVAWHHDTHSVYGHFPTEEKAQMVAKSLTPAANLHDGRVLWRHEHKTSYSGIVNGRFELLGAEIIQWSLQQTTLEILLEGV